MSIGNNIVDQIAKKHLGKVGGDGYKDQYDPSLLVKIPRIHNREVYGMTNDHKPWTHGFDVWNAYEVSALTLKGQPVVGMVKIVCPESTSNHVESKSLKLYLNSLNMSRFGNTKQECIQQITETISKDLSELLEGVVRVGFFDTLDNSKIFNLTEYKDLSYFVNLDNIEFTEFNTNKDLLKIRVNTKPSIHAYRFRTDLLRSNCRVTNQPDWGDMYVDMIGPNVPDFESIAKYVVSHRKTNHFHEEIAEMTYKHFMEVFNPTYLTVACLYTRRGGIDINPIRSNSFRLIDEQFYSTKTMLGKTLRQ